MQKAGMGDAMDDSWSGHRRPRDGRFTEQAVGEEAGSGLVNNTME